MLKGGGFDVKMGCFSKSPKIREKRQKHIKKHVCAYTILDLYQEINKNSVFLYKKACLLHKVAVTLHRQKKNI